MTCQITTHTRQQQSTAMPAVGSVLQRTCACGNHTMEGGECEECRKKMQPLQRASLSLYGKAAEAEGEVPSIVHEVLRSPGQPLDPATRAFFEPRFGHDFSQVRVHTDAEASESARAVNALAYTVGRDIVFRKGQYAPGTNDGRRLLTHELMHTLQQGGGEGRPYLVASGFEIDPVDSREEREAETQVDCVMNQSVANSAVAWFHARGLASPTVLRLQRRTAAQQIATVIRNAVDGLGTDEQAIFNSLTGRTPAEIADIISAYRALSGGETLEERLRDELSGDDLARALSLLRGETAVTEAARQIWNAVRGLGTDEEAVYALVAGRTAGQWVQIQRAYQGMTGENLLARLRDELTDREWEHLQTLLPGAEGGAVTTEDRATVLANQIEAAVEGPGTDEEAIYSALTGRTDAELREIERRFRLLSGQELDARLREELTNDEYELVQRLLHPLPNPERLARRLREAVEGPGTDESTIIAILTGRSVDELRRIREAYQRLYREVLRDRLREELSGTEALEALGVEAAGVLPPEDEIKIAISGPGTDEERLFAVLTEIGASRATIQNTIDQYSAKGYGDMLADIRDELSGSDLDRAMELLHGLTPSGTCSAKERETGLLAISEAVSLAQNAVSELNGDISRGRLSGRVESALKDNFNPGNAAGAVTVALATQVRDVLSNARNDILTASEVACGALAPCVARPVCTDFTYGWTLAPAGSTVRLCPAFFSCLDQAGRARGTLHEFVHHVGVSNAHECYKHGSCFSALTPSGDGSATDSLDHADTYASLAVDLV